MFLDSVVFIFYVKKIMKVRNIKYVFNKKYDCV